MRKFVLAVAALVGAVSAPFALGCGASASEQPSPSTAGQAGSAGLGGGAGASYGGSSGQGGAGQSGGAGAGASGGGGAGGLAGAAGQGGSGGLAGAAGVSGQAGAGGATYVLSGVVTRFVIQDGSVYYTSGAGTEPGTGTVSSQVIEGGSPVLLAAQQDKPASIYRDATGLYWNNLGVNIAPGAIVHLPASSSSPVVLTTLSTMDVPIALAVDDTSAYFAHDGGVSLVAKLGGASTPFVSVTAGQRVSALLVDKTSVFYCVTTDEYPPSTVIHRVGKTDHTDVVLATVSATRILDAQLDADAMYVVVYSYTGSSSTVSGGSAIRFAKADGSATTVIPSIFPGAVTVGDTDVFVSASSTLTGEMMIMKAPKLGGPVTTIVTLPKDVTSSQLQEVSPHIYFQTNFGLARAPR